MPKIYGNFDFALLDSRDFKEDSVREELIVPLIKALGFQAGSDNNIVRSRSLVHPFVYIGTKKHKVSIIPDYLLEVDGKCVLVLDAKAPNVAIANGKAVEQAYSYAIHKDVRASLYGLCNGRELIVFHISKLEPMVHVNLRSIDDHWPTLSVVLSPEGLRDAQILRTAPDLGLHLKKMGFGQDVFFYFPKVRVYGVSFESSDLFSLMAFIDLTPDDTYLASFDVTLKTFLKLARKAPHKRQQKMQDGLNSAARSYILREPFLFPSLKVCLGSNIYNKDDESYLPLIVRAVL